MLRVAPFRSWNTCGPSRRIAGFKAVGKERGQTASGTDVARGDDEIVDIEVLVVGGRRGAAVVDIHPDPFDFEFFHVTHFTAVKDSADVSIAQSSVQVKDDNTYHIKAISETHDIKFDLVFEKKAPAQLLANNVPGYSDWEISSWLVYMPSAKVTGTVYANGKTTTLANAKGYHAQLVGIARGLSPMVQEWLVSTMNENEFDERPVLEELVDEILFYLSLGRDCVIGHTHNEVDEVCTIFYDGTAQLSLPPWSTQ